MVAEVLIPIRFYGYDTIIYFVSALIGFAIAYKAMKLHEISGAKPHRFLYLAFTLLSVGMLTLSATTAFTYLKYFQEHEFLAFNGLFDVADFGYWIYFLSSMLAYILLIKTYSTKLSEKFAIGFLITSNYYVYFNILLLFLISFVAFKTVANYFSRKSADSALVAAGFVLIALYHGLQLFTFADKIVYVLANISLVAGFLSLLIMLIRVNRYALKKSF